MSAWSRARSWLRLAANQSAVDRAQLDEWQFHIGQRAADLERQGVAAAEALRQACAEFGSLDARHEESRDAVGLRLFDDLWADLRYAFRLLRQSPTFTAVAVLSLGLGIGANTTIFDLVNALLLKPLPVGAPHELVTLYTSDFSGPPFGGSSYPDALDFAQRTPALSGLAVSKPSPLSLTGRGIRLALCADRRHVTGLVVGQGLGLTLVGAGLGLAMAVAVTRFVGTFLNGLSPLDPLAFASAAVALTTMAGLAIWLPARRAAHVDPAVTLRQD